MGDADAMDQAEAADADVVIFEEGGPIGLIDVMHRCRCRAIVSVSMTTSQAWTIRREECARDPNTLIDRIVGTCLEARRAPMLAPSLG
jgi:hypothetical protein